MASEEVPPHKPNDLPQIHRYITDHSAQGESIFSSALPEALPGQKLYNGAHFLLGYATDRRPVELTDGQDLKTYAPLLESPPGLTVPGGTVARFVDSPPNSLSTMHRTISLDYGVVIEGEVELVLDSGETRLLKRGDFAVQRGTMHAWRNPSKTEWARMLYFLQDAAPLEVAGKQLGEDYGSMAGHVEKSGS
ncbi:hypothetical protein BJ170DRAFT_583747 [Xylariales sp. AK1849]|nr:hypothetical protein BJ170DRAFT_583747 [Xylariales sp. AK1849]